MQRLFGSLRFVLPSVSGPCGKAAVACVTVAVLTLWGTPAGAQWGAPLDDDTRRAAVERIGALMIENYVFPEVAEACDRRLRRDLEQGAYDDLDQASAFSHALTEALQDVSEDKHLRVRPRPHHAQYDNEGTRDREAEFARRRQEGRLDNFGFEQVFRLDDNVGLIDLRGFQPVELCQDTAVAAMNFLSNSDALIFDLRQNGGGDPKTVQLISSYLFDEKTHLNSLYWRKGDVTDEFWTLDEVSGPRMADVPVFVLTSRYTFSAAEEFTYNLKCLERATIVGETTGGGAHPGDMFAISDDLSMFISTGRAINPITGTNWEGTGVAPDVATNADDALDAALELARKAARKRQEGAS